MLRKSLISSVIFLGLSMPAISSEQDLNSGNYMLEACSIKEATFTNGVCLGRLDGLDLGLDLSDSKIYCRPKKSSNGQMNEVYVAYLRSHPELRHLDWAILFMVAMNNAWPCEGGAKFDLSPDGKVTKRG